MPRKARIDALDAVHHVIVCGIERHNIFRDNQDRNNLIERIGTVIEDTAPLLCLGAALLFGAATNQVHPNVFIKRPNEVSLRVSLQAHL